MPYIEIDEVRGGTLFVDGILAQRGRTVLPEGFPIESAERACEGLRWAHVHPGDPEHDSPEHEPMDSEPPRPALPIDSEKHIAAADVDPHAAARADRLAELVKHDGHPTKEAKENALTCTECDQTMKSQVGFDQHMRLKHGDPELADITVLD